MIILQTFILGIVEGLTEFIPISSTAHLLLTGRILGVTNDQFLETLSICIQSGAILAVVWFFWRLIMENKDLVWKVIIGFIPTALAGLFLYPLIQSVLFNNTRIIALALILGGIGLILVRPTDKPVTPGQVSAKQAFWIGLMQIFSFIPGVSRIGATLIGGSLLKIPRFTIITFSFLLAVPTILGASFVEIRHTTSLTSPEWFLIIFGSIIAFVVALLTIKFFIRILTQKPLSWWGWYRIVVGLCILLFL